MRLSARRRAQPPPKPSGALTRLAVPMLPLGSSGAIDDVKTGPRVVLKEGATTYKMWYEAVPGANQATVGYATSTNGTSWTKQGTVMSPSASWEGGASGETSPHSIIYEGGTYKLWYHSYDGTNRRIGYATSTDGTTWTKSGSNPVLNLGTSGQWDDNQIAEPRVFKLADGTYRMYYAGHRSGDAGWSMGFATSADGIAWTRGGQIFGTANLGSGFGLWFDGTRWNNWYDTGGFASLGYAWSTNGTSGWTVGTNNPVLLPSATSTDADFEGVGDSVSVYRDGSQYRVMYTGINISSYPGGRFEGICLATIG